MKTLIVTSLLFGLSLSLFGQNGEIYFDNYVPGQVNAPVTRPDGTGAGVGITAQLMMVTSAGDLVPLGPATTFRTSSAATTFYVNPVVVMVQGVLPGTVVEVRMVAFSGNDFATATLKGESSEVAVTVGGGLILPPNLIGLQGFTLSSQGTGPVITTNPQSQTVAVGTHVTLSVGASGTTPITFQWQLNGKNITGATGANLELASVKTTDSGTYRAVAQNAIGSATSQGATLNVLLPPHITTPAQNLLVTLGSAATFSVSASGSTLKYQWQYNGTPIQGATASTLKLPAVQLPNVGTYTVVVSNDVGKDSSSATLTIVGAPFVQRHLPNGYSPGSKLTVTLSATPSSATQSYLIEDTFPASWTVGAISDNGVYDTINQKVKFGPVFDHSPHTYTYDVTPPTKATGPGHFTGDAVADGRSSQITGDDTLNPISLHPADDDPADLRITGVELTAYGAAWKHGDTWKTGPNPIPASYVSRAGALWRGGEYYKVDPTITAGPPLWWVNTTAGPQSLVPTPSHPVGLESTSNLQGALIAAVPGKYVPGLAITVESRAVPPAGTLSYVVEEIVPAGWTVSQINENGAFDAASNTVKWGLFFDGSIRELSFDMLAPTDSTGLVQITGVASFDGQDVALTGNTQSVASSQLAPPTRNNQGGLDFSLTGGAGQNFTIEVSTDLVNWTQLKTFHNLNGLLHFEDSQAQGLKQKFFRAIVLP